MIVKTSLKKALLFAGLFYCAAIWGATFFVVKDTLSACSPVALVGWRFFISAALLLPFAWSELNKGMREAVPLAAALAGLYLAQTWGLLYTSASNSGFITGLFIVFVPLLALFLGSHKGGARQWSATALALLGLWFVTGGISGFNRGDALTVMAAACYAAHLLLTENFVRKGAALAPLAFHQFWMTGAVCLLVALLGGQGFGVATQKAWWTVIFLALFPTLSAFFIQMYAQRSVDAVKVSLIFALEPAFAAVFAWTLGGESFRLASALGGALIIAAVILDALPSAVQKTLMSRNADVLAAEL